MRLAAILLLCTSAAFAVPSRYQWCNQLTGGTAVSSLNCGSTTGSNSFANTQVQPNDLLIVSVRSSVIVSSVADTRGLTYFKLAAPLGVVNPNNTNSSWFYAQTGAAAAGNDTITVTLGSSTASWGFTVTECAGCATTALSGNLSFGSSSNAGSTAVAFGTFSTNQANDLVVGNAVSFSRETCTSGSNVRLSNSNGVCMIDSLQVSAGSVSPTATWGASASTIAHSAAFKTQAGSYAFVQNTQNATGGTRDIYNLTMTSALGVGHFVNCSAVWFGGHFSGMTDNAGDTFIPWGPTQTDAHGDHQQSFYAYNTQPMPGTSTGATQISMIGVSFTFPLIQCSEYSGIVTTTNPFDNPGPSVLDTWVSCNNTCIDINTGSFTASSWPFANFTTAPAAYMTFACSSAPCQAEVDAVAFKPASGTTDFVVAYGDYSSASACTAPWSQEVLDTNGSQWCSNIMQVPLASTFPLAPPMVQSNTTNVTHSCSPCTGLYLDNVTSGNNSFLAFVGRGTTASPTDTVGTSYTMSSLFSINDGSGTAYLQTGCGVVPSSGADTVSVAAGTFNSVIEQLELPGIGTCTPDGSDTAYGSLTSQSVSLTTHPVTSNSYDICFSSSASWAASANHYVNGGSVVAGEGSLYGTTAEYREVGQAGAQAITYSFNTLSSLVQGWLVHTDCYSPTFAITTASLPHGALGQPYSAPVQEMGGTGTSRTYSISVGSLPPGLTIDSGSGLVSGTPSGGVGTSNFTVQLTDGTHTVTKALSIGIGASLATPTLAGHHAFALGPYTYSGTAGNYILLVYWGSENSGALIWTPNFLTGSNNEITSSPALTFKRLYVIPAVPGTNNGANGAPASIYAACLPTTTTYTLDMLGPANTGGSQFHGTFTTLEFSGLQVTDNGFTGNIAGFNSSPGTATVNATSAVPNTMALLFGDWGTSVNSPFTLIDATTANSVQMLTAYDLVSSAGAITGTMNSTCSVGTNCQNLALNPEIIPLRPDISGLPCGANPVGSSGRNTGFVF